VVLILLISPSVFAVDLHEDPEEAKPVFSGISILEYYSETLDYVLQKNPSEVEARLGKMPFANIPDTLDPATEDFAASGIKISHLVVAIDEDINKLIMLRQQFRLDEAIGLASETFNRINDANQEIEEIELASESTGAEFKASSAPEQSMLGQSYNQLLERIDRIRELLDRYQELWEMLLEAKDVEGLELAEIALTAPLKQTEITLEIKPAAAFVGDYIQFKGVVTSEMKPLSRREIDILLNSSRYVTVGTDAFGRFEGIVQVPYWYTPELDLQALYYPRDDDENLYLASLSPVITIQVLFYEADLEVAVEEKAYPGLETPLNMSFDYGQAPPLNTRSVEIYLDDVLINKTLAKEESVQQIKIPPEKDVGEHVITISSPPVDRYAPAVDSVILNVTRAIPTLDLALPQVAIIPGSISLEGKLYSEVGPLNQASIEMVLGASQVEFASLGSGAFNAEMKVGMGLGVVGSQALTIQILPREPWHAPLNTTRSLLLVNIVNCGAFVVILLFLGIYLPSRLRRRLGLYSRRSAIPVAAKAQPDVAATNIDNISAIAEDRERKGANEGPRYRILYWYRLVVRLLQRSTRAVLQPQQTLREFAKETTSIVGPAAQYFVQLTRIVERLLYSQYRPTEKDVSHSEQLVHKIEEEAEF
jgi:hypothetical protein